MSSSTSSRRIPRLLRHDLAKQWIQLPPNPTPGSSGSSSSSNFWSPSALLTNQQYFSPNLSLTVKRSTTSRFFMYEEHSTSKLQDDQVTQVIQCSPTELADLLHNNKTKEAPRDVQGEGGGSNNPYYCYWTSPVGDVAHNLLNDVLGGYQSLYDSSQQQQLLDPRGPSLWMGNAGSGTQAHYDVADNVLVQLYGTKRIQCYPPSSAKALHVFPDAHPRARKSQINFDDTTDHLSSDEVKTKFPHYSSLRAPILDVVLEPGMAISIPAFWFHHVENGPSSSSSQQEQEPTLSLNLFALSHPMMIAQQIFQRASRPVAFSSSSQSLSQQQQVDTAAEVLPALKALSESLFESLRLDAKQFIRQDLLETRYLPLMGGMSMMGQEQQHVQQPDSKNNTLSPFQQEQVQQCIDRIVPLLESLRRDYDEQSEEGGIMELVLAHLLELWAVEMVGSNNVAKVWEQVLVDL